MTVDPVVLFILWFISCAMLSIGLWVFKIGVPVKWYELLSVMIGVPFGGFAVILAFNSASLLWLSILIPSLLLIGFGWGRLFQRYKASTSIKK